MHILLSYQLELYWNEFQEIKLDIGMVYGEGVG